MTSIDDLYLVLKLVKPTGFTAKVIKTPKSFPMAVGAKIYDGHFPNKDRKEKLVMCEYDGTQDWVFYCPIVAKKGVCEVAFYHVRLYQGQMWGLDNMPIEAKQVIPDEPSFLLTCKTGYHGADEFFVFQLSVDCDAWQRLPHASAYDRYLEREAEKKRKRELKKK